MKYIYENSALLKQISMFINLPTFAITPQIKLHNSLQSGLLMSYCLSLLRWKLVKTDYRHILFNELYSFGVHQTVLHKRAAWQQVIKIMNAPQTWLTWKYDCSFPLPFHFVYLLLFFCECFYLKSVPMDQAPSILKTLIYHWFRFYD